MNSKAKLLDSTIKSASPQVNSHVTVAELKNRLKPSGKILIDKNFKITREHVNSDTLVEEWVDHENFDYNTSKLNDSFLKFQFIKNLNLSIDQLSDLQNIPNKFYYLRMKGKNNFSSSFSEDENYLQSIYNLEVVSETEIDKRLYFTLSKEGVTMFTDLNSEFTKLSQFEREFILFHKLKKIQFFRLYRIWKSYSTWKKNVRRGKMALSVKSLNEKLFIFNRSLCSAMLSAKSLTLDLRANSSVISLEPNDTIFTLEEFLNIQSQCYDNIQRKLDDLSNKIISLVRIACDDVIDSFLKANNINSDNKMTFMERASLRAQCKRLTRFLKMIDIFVIDFLIFLVLDSVANFAKAVSLQIDDPDMIEPQIHTSNRDTIASLLKKRHVSTSSPLFHISIQFSDFSFNDISILPSCDYFVRKLEFVISNSIDVVKSCLSIYNAPELESYRIADGLVESNGEFISEDNSRNEGEDVMDLPSIIKFNSNYVKHRDTILKFVNLSYSVASEYLEVFKPFIDTVCSNLKFIEEIPKNFNDVSRDAFTDTIDYYENLKVEFLKIPQYAMIGAFFVDSESLKTTFEPSPCESLASLRAWIPKVATIRAQELLDNIGELNPILASDPSSVDAYILKKKAKDTALENLESFRDRENYIISLVSLMEENKLALPEDLKVLNRMLRDSLPLLESNIQLADGKEEDDVKRFCSQLNEDCPKLIKRVTECREKLDAGLISDPLASEEKVIKYLTQIETDFLKLKSTASQVQEYQVVLKIPVEEFDILDEVQADLSLKIKLWKDIAEWRVLRESLLSTFIYDLDIESLERYLQRFNKTVALANKGLPNSKVVLLLKSLVDEINPMLPIVVNLRSDSLQNRHWEKLNSLVGFDIKNSRSCSLQELINLGVSKFHEEISIIAMDALQESILEEMMTKVTVVWENTNFEVKPYKDMKDLYILGDTSDVVAVLDDCLVTINTVLGSRYVGGIREYVNSWRSKLLHLQMTLDEWLVCQKNWMYLETIFSSADIIKQLPGPAKTFQIVDKSWKYIMKLTKEDANVLRVTTNDLTRYNIFKSHNANLDQIQKDLEDYLETKRMAFPRFYFLSDDELLEILSQSKDPKAVQPHLRKCFDNLVRLEFGSEESTSNDIIAMYSSENERVPLGKNLKARGAVEDWLTAVEKRMKESLTVCMKTGLVDYDSKPRELWISFHPGQVVATVAQIIWARNTELALNSSNPIEEMISWGKRYKEDLLKLIDLIRGSLTKLMRCIVVALVTTDVHARDIIDEIIDRKVDSAHNFLWQQQLRYYWDKMWNESSEQYSDANCFIRHSDAIVKYGYEYMGATSRLVITPLTDRCWLTLTGSYALKLGAAPAGPAGTGKTESSKDLAKALGIQCVVFNCSDQIDYKMMGKLFRGLAQGGGWVCLDEFNRIDIEVLSVIAQQLLILREGRIACKPIVNFMGITIPLVDHHVIITMNPGYAGRTELPDNLQVCFRPVSMMVPNYSLIAEIMLFAEGFNDAKNLSRKMCKLYILCSEQLSQQPHYDYGLRAVKSVLVMAGALKRANPNMDEELVLIRALRDSNVPKFLADDLPLFAAIVQDLFPGVDIPPNDYGEFEETLREVLKTEGLQDVPLFITKIIQMFDILKIRFGATLVGPASTGKSTIYRTLAKIMTKLRVEKGSLNADYQKVRYKVLNPKSISMGDLYGEFNALTQEWRDGLASTIMREFVSEGDSDEKRWTVFDGPIDALWIESMNTVLDDNMTLCLANGERIKLKSEMKCLFEVNDLAEASPATVSRIGVVFVSPTDLGYMPYVTSWMENKLIPILTDITKDPKHLYLISIIQNRLDFLFLNFFQKGLQLQRKLCKEPIATVDMQEVVSFCTLFQILVVESLEKAIISSNGQQDSLVLLIDRLFCFSFVWSVGASVSYQHWIAFSDFTRELCEEVSPSLGLPPNGLVYDYFIDIDGSLNYTSNLVGSAGKFREWMEIVPTFSYNPTMPYFSLLVPTPDTCRFFSIVERLIYADRPCFCTGVTGSGKTVSIQNLLSTLSTGGEKKIQIAPIFMNFSAQTSSFITQITIESKLEKKRKTLLGAPSGKRSVIFVDDVNMPLVETYGAMPPIELLRQFLDFKGFYDRENLFWKDITDVTLFVGAAPPGGGRSQVSTRFSRHFTIINIPAANDSTLSHIFGSILGGFLTSKSFDSEIIKLRNSTVNASIELYNKIAEELLPTPAKFHYTFNLRDISKVFQGILMITPRKCSTSESFMKLWIHEVSRVFRDRLVSQIDQIWFDNCISELSIRHFKGVTVEDTKNPILFTDCIKPDADVKFYEEIRDFNKLESVLNDMLDQYNLSFPNQMNLVFFQDALLHTARLVRILRQPRGNAMLIGVGGSGKQSLTRVAAFVSGMTCSSIEINRGYGINQFREDIKKLMLRCGIEGQDTVFLFTDSQIIDETMLEDLNNILNTGEVSNLFASDENDRIVADMIAICKANGIPETRENCLSYFVSRIRDKLHVVLCMSPVGDAMRIRCRQFPSLINCTTIDWFHGWPESALVSVAKRFLDDLELPTPEIRNAVVNMCGYVHSAVESLSDSFFVALGRRVYTTPKSYLDLIDLYISMLKSHLDIINTKLARMKVGVQKLEETNKVVDALRNELMILEPVLKEKSKETELLLVQVAKDTEEANIVANKVMEEKAIVDAQAAETEAVATDAQRDLDKAMPALESAIKALNSLTKADITEVKSFTNPPRPVQIVMEAVCVLLGEKESWEASKKLLGQSDFMDLLTNFDKDNIPEKRLKKLRKDFINLDEMQPDTIVKVSKAGTGLCLWVRAMDVYADVAKEVEPKKEKLQQMTSKLNATREALAIKESQLQEVMDRVALLQKKCDDTLAEKNRLQEESDVTAARLVRAEKLINGLSSEGERWKESIETLLVEKNNCIGDIFLSSACISYYGSFTGSFRNQLVDMWVSKADELNIPSSGKKFSLTESLGDPVRIREWQNQGLPTDAVSVNSGIIVDKCRRWPLMIDPQNQANAWIRKLEEKNNLQVTTMQDGNLLRILESCIRLGRPLLLEDIGEQIEPALEPVLLKSIFKVGGRQLIRIGDADVDYDSNFRLYMTTKLPNPHYLPEVCIKVTIINFTVTLEGLEAQLLGDVVKLERPDIENRKVQLLLQMAEDKKQLQHLESEILRLLSESEGNILDDEVLINTLSSSKVTSSAISQRVEEAEITEIEINEARSRYLPVATRGSLIYFVIADLSSIDPMYQYSLSYYATLFSKCVMDSQRSADLDIRLNNIIEYSTSTIYLNICRGLFEKDKLVFSSSICFAILRQLGDVSELEWQLFIRGASAILTDQDRERQPMNPFPEKISPFSWDLLYAADTLITKDNLNPMQGLCQSLLQYGEKLIANEEEHSKSPWANWFNGCLDNLLEIGLPEFLENISDFQRLLLIKTLREDRLQHSISSFVAKHLGKEFAQAPVATMEDIYPEMDCKSPCIFILSQGSDPTGTLLRFAKTKGYSDRLHIVSLGQGQGPIAKRLIDNGLKTGDWVVLQNCMLAKSWMPELDRIIFSIQQGVLSTSNESVAEGIVRIHPDFRLFLTSSPVPYFPVAILQNGLKMTNEAPRGFRNNLTKSFGSLIKADDYNSPETNHPSLCKDKIFHWRKLICGLVFFHANIQERRKFGPLGWNIRYGFDDSDLETSISVLRKFIIEQDTVPWDALNYVIGQITFGGRVTDDWDRRCLMTILSIYLTPSILEDQYAFSNSGIYRAPNNKMSYMEVYEYFNDLPLADAPEVFGMHENADVAFNSLESSSLMSSLLMLQPRSSGAGSSNASRDDAVLLLISKFESMCPLILQLDDAGPSTFIIQSNGLLSSLAICLTQEIVKFNRLLSTISQSLIDLRKAIQGFSVMSADLDLMYTSFLNNTVPKIWEKVSFASLKTLSSWMNDLNFRINFMREWLMKGEPAYFPLPAFYFPQGFMTASLQTYARKHKVSIDTLSFAFDVLSQPIESIIEPPTEGIIIYGLYLEGARFDPDTSVVYDSYPGKIYDLLPVIHFKPEVNHKKPSLTYSCPVYKTAVRKGVLSTTGLSTNFVVAIELPIDDIRAENKWILAGVAALCNLTD